MILKSILSLLTMPISNIPRKYIFLIIAALIGFECVINSIIIQKVMYTEIDWIAYMQEVSSIINGERNYNNVRGDTGPLVYPAGFVYIFSFLHWITENGSNIRLGQYIFFGIYIFNLFIVLTLCTTSETNSLPLWSLALLILSKRIHSIYVLRMFNDCIAVLFGYIALYYFTKYHWRIGCVFYSISVSIKMNMLLQAPGILLLLLIANGFQETILCLCICASIQLLLGYPFLSTFPKEYLMRSFDIGRIFMFEWTVNFKFLSEKVFVSKSLSIGLLFMTVIGFGLFWIKWIKEAIKSDNPNQVSQSFSDSGHNATDFKNTAATSTTATSTSATTTNYLRNAENSEASSVISPNHSSTSRIGESSSSIMTVSNFWGLLGPRKLSHHYIIYIIFTSNFIGIVFARSLHYQFYCWYYHTLPYLLWTGTALPTLMRLGVVMAVEVAFNVFPATWWSSLLLQIAHMLLLVALYVHPSPSLSAEGSTAEEAEVDNSTITSSSTTINSVVTSTSHQNDTTARRITTATTTSSTMTNNNNNNNNNNSATSSSSSSFLSSDKLSLQSSLFPSLINSNSISATEDDDNLEDTARTTEDTDRTASFSTKYMNILSTHSTAATGTSGASDITAVVLHRPDGPRWGDDSAISISPTNHSRQNRHRSSSNNHSYNNTHNDHTDPPPPHHHDHHSIFHDDFNDNNNSFKQYTSVSSNSHTSNTSSGSNESSISISKPLWGNDDSTVTLTPASIYITHSQRLNEGMDDSENEILHQPHHDEHEQQQEEEEEEEVLPPMEIEIVRMKSRCSNDDDDEGYDDFITINSTNTNESSSNIYNNNNKINNSSSSSNNSNNNSSSSNNLFVNCNWPPKDSTKLPKAAKLLQYQQPPPSSSSPPKPHKVRRDEVLNEDDNTDIDPNIAWPKDSTKLTNMSKLRKEFL